MYDPQLYRDKQEIEEWKQRDPLTTFQARMQAQGLLGDDDLKQLEDDIAKEITAAIEFAEGGTWEPVEDLTRFVHSEKEHA
jgi:TPP-dependent pyruvate/acetoin dehydrogenase alpha subunit